MLSQKRKRKSYSFVVKLRAIALAEEKGNRAAAREFEVNESMIRDWCKKPQMKKRPKRGGKATFPHLGRSLKDWVISQRESSRAVTTVIIQLKAKELSTQMNLADFVGGPSWCHQFMRRNRLSVRTRIPVWLYHGAGYTLIYFSKRDIFVAVQVICRADYCLQNTVPFL